MEAPRFGPSTPYVRRLIDDDLDELFPELAAVLLDGPKGVGKTATAVQRAVSVRRLDDPVERAVVAADPRLLADDPRPLLVDEWHRVPGVLDVVRRLVDDQPGGGQFLLTGSLPTVQTHSGAGRITTMRLRPLTFGERTGDVPTVSLRRLMGGDRVVGGRTTRTLRDYAVEIVAGGLPGLRGLGDRASALALDSYVDRIVDHDMVEAGMTVRRPGVVRAWLAAYAAAVGTTASAEKIRYAAGQDLGEPPARSTTTGYVDLLARLRILDPVEAWMPSRNHMNALLGVPKHHLADPALAVRLTRRTSSQLLRGDDPVTPIPRDGAFLGNLFESLVTLSVRTYAQLFDSRVGHVRTKGGRHEVDLIVDTGAGVMAIEVKLAAAVSDRDVVHLRWLRKVLGDELIDAVVVSTGPEAYRRQDGIAVVPFALLGP